MDWMNQLGGLLEQYSGASAQRAPQSVDDDFDAFTQAAPQGAIAEALSEAFRSDQTPAFGQMAAQLFGQSNGSQRAGMLNTLIATLGPTLVAQFLARGGSSGLADLLGGGQTRLTPQQAEQVSPEEVKEIAARAEEKDPSIIDTFSNFYAEHPTLIKTLGGMALTVALAKMAQHRGGS